MNLETAPAAPAIVPARRRPLTILVIDDEEAMLNLVGLTLEYDGHTVLSASNGEEGREIALHAQPDIILCDVNMPGMSGHQVLDALRSDYQTRHIPFIFLTGCRDHQSIRLGMAAGAAEYLLKPFRPDELDEAITACVRKLVRYEQALKLPPARTG
jgi:CheY-like chemotaxis protein